MILLVWHRGEHKRYEIEKEQINIGRGANADIQVFSSSVARWHCRLMSHQGIVFAQDLHSTNGTYLNGALLQHPQPLRTGDKLQLAQEATIEVQGLSSWEETSLEGMAKDPNLPLGLLYLLAGRYPGAFLENPLLPLLVLEDPGFFSKTPGWFFLSLLSLSSLPEGLWRAGLQHQDLSAQSHTAQAEALPRSLMEEVLCSGSVAARMGLSNNPAAPEELLRALARDPDAQVRKALVSRRALPAEVLASLENDESEEVRRVLSWRHRTEGAST